MLCWDWMNALSWPSNSSSFPDTPRDDATEERSSPDELRLPSLTIPHRSPLTPSLYLNIEELSYGSETDSIELMITDDNNQSFSINYNPFPPNIPTPIPKCRSQPHFFNSSKLPELDRKDLLHFSEHNPHVGYFLLHGKDSANCRERLIRSRRLTPRPILKSRNSSKPCEKEIKFSHIVTVTSPVGSSWGSRGPP